MRARMPREKARAKRRLVWIGVALVGAIALVVGLVLAAPRPRVDVARVTRGTYLRVVEEDGRARIRERYVVSAPLAGALERIALHVGDRVQAGDVVAILRPAPSPLIDPRARTELEERRGAAEARLASTRAEVARTEAARAQAQSDLARTQHLARMGAVAARDLEHAELALTVAARERDAARHAAHLAEHDLQQATAALRVSTGATDEGIELRAPVAGHVLEVPQESEAVVATGTTIMEIGDPGALEVVVDLLSTDAVRVVPGTRATIMGWGGGEALPAVVRTVEPVAAIQVSALGVEEERVDVIVDPLETSEGWERVGHGYRVDVRIPVERIDDALVVPTSALFREGDEWRLFVVRDGAVRTRSVVVASYGPLESALREGVDEGELVVLQPPESLREGDRVEADPG